MSDVVGAVDLETAKKQLRVEYTEDDALITAYIAAATAQCEQICGREIVKRTDSNALCESVDTVPAAVKTWVLLTVTDLYEKRGRLRAQWLPAGGFMTICWMGIELFEGRYAASDGRRNEQAGCDL